MSKTNTQTLFEVSMKPGTLKRLASSISGAKVGIEFEMVVPDAYVEDEEGPASDPDYSYDRSVSSIQDIIEFFGDGDAPNSDYQLSRVRAELEERFESWREQQIENKWEDEGLQFFSEWCHANISEEKVAEYLQLEPDLLGDRILNDEQWDKYIKENFDSQTEIYYDAERDFRDHVLDNFGEDDEEEFLESIGIERAQDVNGTLTRTSLNWPYYEITYPEGQRVEDVAEEFSDYIGKSVYSAGDHGGARRTSEGYSLEPDPSIRARDGDAGLELISHPMSVSEMITDLKEVFGWAEERGCYTNNSTGLHINVSVPNYSIDNLDYVKLAVLLGDNYVLEKFNRVSYSYARSALDIIINKASADDVDRLLSKLKENVDGIASKILHSGRTDKYVSINTHPEYVEFRGPGGNWLDKNIKEIEDTIYRFVVALDAACDPNKYKNDYRKAVYKLLKSDSNTDQKTLFAKFMSGEINQADYRNIIEQERVKRLSKSGLHIIPFAEVGEDDWQVLFDDGGLRRQRFFIKGNNNVNTLDKATKAAAKLRQSWFTPANIDKVEVTQYTFDPEIYKLNAYEMTYGDNDMYMCVIAKDEKEAVEILKVLEASKEALYPKRILHSIRTKKDNEASLTFIRNSLTSQTKRLELEYQWLDKKKLWTIKGVYPKLFIAAKTQEEAISIAARMYPPFDPEVNIVQLDEQYPSDIRYQEVLDTQEEIIKRNEDVTPITVFKVEGNKHTRYIAAKTDEEAITVAVKAFPDIFTDRTSISNVEQSTKSYTPEVIQKILRYQVNLINENTRLLKVYRVSGRDSIGHYKTNYIAAYNKEQAVDIASKIYVNVIYGDDTEVDVLDDVRDYGVIRGMADEQEYLINNRPIEEMYRVRNYTTGQEVVLPASTVQNAIGRAIRAYPNWDRSSQHIVVALADNQTNTPARVSNIQRWRATLSNGNQINVGAFDYEDARRRLAQEFGVNINNVRDLIQL